MTNLYRCSFACLFVLLISCGSDQTMEPEPERNLHVPSPDWSNEIIYFILTDRFNDGDPSNNDQGAGEFDPTKESHYSGGDLQGIIDKLDYLQGLGVTAIWITPPVANQWYDGELNYGGYHGYWARHFKRVDEHYGTLDTYKDLSHALHERGMYLIQDVVVNHTGNFFFYENNDYDPADPTQNFTKNALSVPTTAPEQAPFDSNDVTDPGDVAAGIYHWTPVISNHDDPDQAERYQLSDLDDLNTENLVVRDTLRDSFGYWIETVGVDGFRLDTAKYVSHDFWHNFLYHTGQGASGINHVAAATGRDDFLSFGEVFNGSNPFDDAGERKITSYLGTEARPELRAVLNFPMHFTIGDVFAAGRPTAELSYRLQKHLDPTLFKDPQVTPLFIDNHDVARFLSKGSVAGLKQALGLLFTIPGIPIIYQGTEQGFTTSRAAMFANGWNPDDDSNGDAMADSDHFDSNADLYQFIAELTAMRKARPVFTRGELNVRADTTSGPGLLIYERKHAGETALVLFNTAAEDVLLSNFDTGLPEGRKLELLASSSSSQAAVGDVVVGVGGKYTTELPARSLMVLLVTEATEEVTDPPLSVDITSDVEGQTFSQDFTITGTSSMGNAKIDLVIDGLLSDTIPVTADADGKWSVEVPIARFGPGTIEHTVTAYVREYGVASASGRFKSRLDFAGPALTVADATGDDVGPAGNYVYPTDSSYQKGQMDIEQVEVFTAGSNVKLTFTMGQVSTVWGPVNGFDHVSFNVYFDLPGQTGTSVLPLINASAPADFAWDVASATYGWGNGLYLAQDATADAWGKPTDPAPQIDADVAARTVSLTFSTRALGRPTTLSGTKIYVTTWDIDGISGTYRQLAPEVGAHVLGGGSYDSDPLIMDAIDEVIVLP